MHTWHGQPEQNSFHRLLWQWGGVLGRGGENLYRTGPYHCFTSNHALAGAEAFPQAKERQLRYVRRVLGDGQMMCSSYKTGFTEADNKCAAKSEAVTVLGYMQLVGSPRDLTHASAIHTHDELPCCHAPTRQVFLL